jgi:dihydroxynaphthoic acid synthetase
MELQVNYSEILYDVDRNVATITINRPDKYNAVRTETLEELADAFRRAGADREVGVIVLTGAGDKAFCSGGDVGWEAEGSLEEREAELLMRAVYAEMRASLKPIIARINGYSIGGGNHMAYVCDFSIAAEHAIFGQVGPRVGSPAQGWLVSYLVRVVGAKRAREMWMLCRRYTAQQMLQWGLVNEVVPLDDLDATVRQWCDELLSLSPTVLKVVKRSFDEEYADLRSRQEAADYLQDVNPDFFASGEQLEGARAFLDKRPPDYSRFR